MTTDTQAPVTIRDGGERDQAFVYSSWLQSYRSSAFARPIPTHTYFDRHHAVLERILARPTTRIVVATPEDAPAVILGWAVTEGLLRGSARDGAAGPVLITPTTSTPTLHYVYVKEQFRKLGIARQLVTRLGRRFAVTHRTAVVEGAMRRRPDVVYDPYLI